MFFLIILLGTFWCPKPNPFFYSFDGVKIAYTDEGTGRPLLLIQGFINTGSSWNNTVLKTELLNQGYRVIIPDMRGNGLSDKPHEEMAYEQNAEVKDIIVLASQLGLKRYDAVGYSRGSVILAKLLTQDRRV